MSVNFEFLLGVLCLFVIYWGLSHRISKEEMDDKFEHSSECFKEGWGFEGRLMIRGTAVVVGGIVLSVLIHPPILQELLSFDYPSATIQSYTDCATSECIINLDAEPPLADYEIRKIDTIPPIAILLASYFVICGGFIVSRRSAIERVLLMKENGTLRDWVKKRKATKGGSR
ncbi:hypothetical protein LCGC14_2738200 [marine sediment metagenome]|uniref:Uncharacterized protein n=1 Tax=marine sediment metagenome TaxID=412755 RepID=A0A0F8ZSI8_9ZZZZ